MKLLTEDLKKRLPALYANEDKGLKAEALIHFFSPGSNWDWYASEGSYVDANGFYDTDKEKVDFLFFGLVSGFEVELGYFSLNELESVRVPVKFYRQDTKNVAGIYHYPIERDLYWTPKTLEALLEKHTQERNRQAA
jgi:hypothetical protein